MIYAGVLIYSNMVTHTSRATRQILGFNLLRKVGEEPKNFEGGGLRVRFRFKYLCELIAKSENGLSI
jgi:hypothetical protein